MPAADMCRRWQHIQGNFAANCVGGHRPIARFAVKFCRRLWSRAPPAADTARRSRGGGRRAQSPLQGAQRDAGTATRNPKGETGASGSAVRDCCPFWSLSSFSTSSAPSRRGAGRRFLFYRARPCKSASSSAVSSRHWPGASAGSSATPPMDSRCRALTPAPKTPNIRLIWW